MSFQNLSKSEAIVKSRELLAKDPKLVDQLIADRLAPLAKYRLTGNQFAAAYLAGDGFGRLTFAEANDLCWDWSHIRDSSDKARLEIAAIIANCE